MIGNAGADNSAADDNSFSSVRQAALRVVSAR